MATFFFPLLCLLLFSSVSSALNELPESGFITLPVKMDTGTKQYYTSIGIGSPRHDMNLVIDLSGGLLWYDCDSHYNSSSFHPVSCDSQTCPPTDSSCGNCDGPLKPGCTNNTCAVFFDNQFSDISFGGSLIDDLLHMPHIRVPRSFIAGCADPETFSFPIFVGISNVTKGMFGLGRTQLSLPIQLSSTYNIIPKFTLCLPSSSNKKGTGGIFIGPGPNVPVSRVSLVTHSSKHYFIDVKSINIDDKVVKFRRSLLTVDANGNGGTKISTLTPYTVLHHTIYDHFVSDFVVRATERKIKRVESVAPFGACFDANTISRSDGGPAVPTIDLVLTNVQGQDVHFSILGHNSMVRVNRDVLCLAFVDGETLSAVRLQSVLCRHRPPRSLSSVVAKQSSSNVRQSHCRSVRREAEERASPSIALSSSRSREPPSSTSVTHRSRLYVHGCTHRS
ncbi:Xylanase inhibitor, C-terminal [Sesbania bispinosa]|nr:Xylanase inhibitor, C-terminal [Sesbania bispinosa]